MKLLRKLSISIVLIITAMSAIIVGGSFTFAADEPVKSEMIGGVIAANDGGSRYVAAGVYCAEWTGYYGDDCVDRGGFFAKYELVGGETREVWKYDFAMDNVGSGQFNVIWGVAAVNGGYVGLFRKGYINSCTADYLTCDVSDLVFINEAGTEITVLAEDVLTGDTGAWHSMTGYGDVVYMVFPRYEDGYSSEIKLRYMIYDLGTGTLSGIMDMPEEINSFYYSGEVWNGFERCYPFGLGGVMRCQVNWYTYDEESDSYTDYVKTFNYDFRTGTLKFLMDGPYYIDLDAVNMMIPNIDGSMTIWYIDTNAGGSGLADILPGNYVVIEADGTVHHYLASETGLTLGCGVVASDADERIEFCMLEPNNGEEMMNYVVRKYKNGVLVSEEQIKNPYGGDLGGDWRQYMLMFTIAYDGESAAIAFWWRAYYEPDGGSTRAVWYRAPVVIIGGLEPDGEVTDPGDGAEIDPPNTGFNDFSNYANMFTWKKFGIRNYEIAI